MAELARVLEEVIGEDDGNDEGYGPREGFHA